MVKEHTVNAKVRYDRKRPVISVRVTHSQKRKVEEMAIATGKSVGRLMREGLKLEQKELAEAYRRGFESGRQEARDECLVRIPCVCGHYFPVVGEERIRVAEDILATYGNWYHSSCRPEGVPTEDCRLFKDGPRKKEKGR